MSGSNCRNHRALILVCGNCTAQVRERLPHNGAGSIFPKLPKFIGGLHFPSWRDRHMVALSRLNHMFSKRIHRASQHR